MANEVLIDGVLYVPVSEGHVDASAIEDALMSQWYGDNWRENYPSGGGYLRVVVGDGFADDEGRSIPEFIASVLSYLGRGQNDG